MIPEIYVLPTCPCPPFLHAPCDVVSGAVWAYLDNVYAKKTDNTALVELIKKYQTEAGYAYGLRGLRETVVSYAHEHQKEVDDVDGMADPLRKEVFNSFVDVNQIKQCFSFCVDQFIHTLVIESKYKYLYAGMALKLCNDIDSCLPLLPLTEYALSCCYYFSKIYPNIDFTQELEKCYVRYMDKYQVTDRVIELSFHASTEVPSAVFHGGNDSIIRIWVKYLAEQMGCELNIDGYDERNPAYDMTQRYISLKEQEEIFHQIPFSFKNS